MRVSWSDYMRAYRARHRGVRCGRCSSTELLTPARCAWCLAVDLERKPWLAGLEHDTTEHSRMLTLARAPRSRCAVSGLTLERLQLGDSTGRTYSLQVDRIRNSLGYVPGNMQLLACRLNRAKQGHDSVPAWAVHDLLADLGIAKRRPLAAFMPALHEGGY